MTTIKGIWSDLRRGNLREVVRHLELQPSLQGIPYLVAGGAVGFFAVLYSTAFSRCIGVAQAFVQAHPFYFLIVSPVCFILSAWVVRRFAPQAGGTGVPQVMKALDESIPGGNGEIIRRTVNLRVGLVSVLSSLLCILGGGGLGREGPMVLIAACIFYFIGNQFRRIWPAADHRSWLVAGGAAGIAAAFQTPLGGVVFVLEELAQEHYQTFRSYVITAVVIAGMIAQWLFGRYLFLGMAQVGAVPVSSVFWALCVGLIAGLAAGAFERSLGFAKARLQGQVEARPLAVAAFFGLLTALVCCFDWRTPGGGIQVVQQLLFSDTRAGWGLIAVRFLGTGLAHLGGCAGGFLAPAVSMGATLGSKFAMLCVPELHSLLVMCGMAAFLGAINRAPFTALIIVMEMTDTHAAIFPLMIASVVGFGAVRLAAGTHVK